MLGKLSTLWALGLSNVVRVVLYRAALRNPFSPIRRLSAPLPTGPFFAKSQRRTAPSPVGSGWQSTADLFGIHHVPIQGDVPEWFTNPLNGKRLVDPSRPWWKIADFDPAFGDIKTIWEMSRMDWLLAFAARAAIGEPDGYDRLEAWLADWVTRNPPYAGPNWKCGQEASIRVLHLAVAAKIMGGAEQALPGLFDLIEVHLRRIEPTMGYAIAQDNNHGTSEAAALFIGGSWLMSAGRNAGARWARLGRRMLEERIARLVEPDGSFSQYSTNYHRLMLDSLSLTEAWRRTLSLPAFSETFYVSARAATNWLEAMTDAGSGDAANIGANDGAQLLPLGMAPYRDYRPSVQLAANLFANRRVFVVSGPWDDLGRWLSVPPSTKAAPAPASARLFDDGGYAVLRQGKTKTIIRYPRFRFRPSHSDALHLDVWHDGSNLLRDSGTFGYNVDERTLARFSGTKGHNTVQFDDRDQMPRFGRFLYGGWLRAREVSLREDPDASFGASYRDQWAAYHHRQVTLRNDGLDVVDTLSGKFEKATLRWRLAPGDWSARGHSLVCEALSLAVSATAPLSVTLTEGVESRYYLQSTALPVLEVSVTDATKITTLIRWAT